MARAQHEKESAVPLKERLYSTMYRFKYGWSFRSSVDIGRNPIWLLGKCYHAEKVAAEGRAGEGVPPHVMEFIQHFISLTWMTYRAGFEPIPGTVLTTDCGWGCMVRSGQMLLANALQILLLGRDWRMTPSNEEDTSTHKKILSWFADNTLDESHFSLHSLMQQAHAHGNRPGDWFGPSQVALLIRDCVENARDSVQELSSLQVYVAHDCTVYVGDVMQVFSSHPGASLLLMVPVRLGSSNLNPIYVPCVKSLLTLDHSLGIIGGRPKHSVYFVGHQDEKLIHLDPHYCQATVVASNAETIEPKSYHCHTPRMLPAFRMDPSCTVGFFCRGEDDFKRFQAQAEPVLAPPHQRGLYPFFTFSAGHVDTVIESSASMQLASLSRTCRRTDEDDAEEDSDSEDFIVVNCQPSDP